MTGLQFETRCLIANLIRHHPAFTWGRR